jgi:hypothetical protein
MKVVDDMVEINFPVYTVHDNFFTTVEYTDSLSKIYLRAIREQDPPLYILNEFIVNNVINNSDKKDLINRVIPSNVLEKLLRKNVPKVISQKMMDTWNKKIKLTVSSYKIYVNDVCSSYQSNSFSLQEHDKKWEKFQSKLRVESGTISYCIHN